MKRYIDIMKTQTKITHRVIGLASLMLIIFLFAHCSIKGKQDATKHMSIQDGMQYEMVQERIADVKEKMSVLYEENVPMQEVRFLYESIEKMQYKVNDPEQMEEAGRAAYNAQQQEAHQLADSIMSRLEELRAHFYPRVYSKEEELVEDILTIPFYLQRGDTLDFTIEADNALAVKLYNADTRQVLKSYNKATVYDAISIRHSAIYLMEVKTAKPQYVYSDICYKAGSVERYAKPRRVHTEIVDAKKGDFRAIQVRELKMQPLFDDAKAFTLRSQLKSIASGNCRVLLPINLPQGTTEILYSVRISNSETRRESDGGFAEGLTKTYINMKTLGAPILIENLLDDNRPLREEDIFCDMYVFTDSQQAKKFQDGASVSNLKYNVDYSTMGTQSCTGKIPTNGKRKIYLGFENPRMRYSTYLWVEVVMARSVLVWKKAIYTLEEEE